MSERNNNITDRAAVLAGQAMQAAGPMLERARVAAEEFAVKAGPYVERAADVAAQGVAVAAVQLDKATSGKYSGKITSVSSKLEETLGRAKH
jgi:hypothetical protein